MHNEIGYLSADRCKQSIDSSTIPNQYQVKTDESQT